MEHAIPVHYEHHDYQTVETSEVPPHGWSDGIFNCLSDGEVALWGACPLGCVQYLFAANAASVGTEKFSDSFLKVVGLSILAPNVLAAAAAAAPSAAPIISPLNTLNQWILAGYGMSNRQAMRRKFNIRGTTDCAVCGCFSFLCDGDEEMIDDFCCYLCCFPCAVCQETRHMRRYNLGDIGRRFRPYDVMAPQGGFGPPGGFASPSPAGGYAPPPAAIMKAETKTPTMS